MGLENSPKGLDVALVMRTTLKREVRDDVGEFECHVLVLHVLDRKQDLGHDILASAGVCGLGVHDIWVMALLFQFAGG